MPFTKKVWPVYVLIRTHSLVRDMWDMQTVAEACKETLGALRAGNKYLIRIIAIDSSGARVGELGPAEFLTTGALDSRQQPFNQSKLDANWKECQSNYAEPAAKADPYSGHNVCPFGVSCTMIDNYAHCVDYNHPRPLACPNGAGCMLSSNKLHTAQFSH